jgi:catalase
MPSQQQWREEYEGGSAEAERIVFEELAKRIMSVQLENKKKSGVSEILRTFHAKIVLGTVNAKLRILDDIASDLRVGYFQPGREYAATIRLSNANGTRRADGQRDMRGAALRITVSATEAHDLLMTSYPVSHARNARQFVTFAEAVAGDKLLVLPRLLLAVGPFETIRMLRNVKNATGHPVRSLALETYWSRGAILWGQAGPVRYQLRPSPGAPGAPSVSQSDPDYLRHELAKRLERGDVGFELWVQRYVDATLTPIEDGSIEWTEGSSKPIKVATLTIPKQDIGADEARAAERLVDQLAFNPWHTTEEFRPLGNLNRARKAVYGASSAQRLGCPFAGPRDAPPRVEPVPALAPTMEKRP